MTAATDAATEADRFGAFLTLARWPNAAISAAAVLLGAWFASGRVVTAVWPAVAAAVFLTAFANADNDACDWQLDHSAHPARPIPSGAVTPHEARAFAWIAALLGTLAATAFDATMGFVTAAIVVNMAIYNRRTSRSPLLKNATVAVLASLPFLYGAWAAGYAPAGVRLAAVAIPLHFAREVAKDIDDAAADAATRRTLPLVVGRRAAAGVIVVALVLFGAGAVLLARGRALRLAPAGLLAARGALASWRGEAGAPTLLKAAMLAAMAAAVTLRAL